MTDLWKGLLEGVLIWSIKLVGQTVEMRRAQSARCEASRIFTTWGNNVENHLTTHSEIHSAISALVSMRRSASRWAKTQSSHRYWFFSFKRPV